MAANPQFVSVPNVKLTKFLTADSTNAKTIFTAGSSGSRVMMASLSSNNGVALTLTLYVTISSVSTVVAQFAIPAVSGATTWAIQSIMDPDVIIWLDRQEPSIILPAGAELTAATSAAVDSGRSVDVTVFGGDF